MVRTKGDASLPGDSPLRNLDRVLRQAGIRLRDARPEPRPERQAPAAVKSDAEMFDEAMHGVAPASWRSRWPETYEPAPPARAPAGASEERRLMQAALEGTPPLASGDHPEYIEGWIGVAGRLLLPNLRSGLYSIQGQLDLHGLGQAEAREAVEEFIARMCRFRSCCVKIIHGRGMNSPGNTPVLKGSLQRWLSTRRMSRYVVAYASAPMSDGGVGAVYVLLRRAR